MPGEPSHPEPSWRPQPGPQERFINATEFEVVYGGARGGGKTDAALGDFAWNAARYGEAAQGLMVRRTQASLDKTIRRARQIYAKDGAKWIGARASFEWQSGACLSFRHLANDNDAELYQGHDYTRVYVEELTQFPDAAPVDKLKATLRSAQGAPCYFRATCNPGGPGHSWVKRRYIDAGTERVVELIKNPFGGADFETDRLFIPAKLQDNPALIEQDPAYAMRLSRSGSDLLVRAWLQGDWNVIMGAFFDGWGERNIVTPFRIPNHWTRFISFDWGVAAPFSVGWWAVVSDTARMSASVTLPRGALVRYREWYGRGADGKGLGLTAMEVARGILARQTSEDAAEGVADPAIFARTGLGPPISEAMREEGVTFRPADNTRVGKLGAISGWNQVRQRILGNELGPMLVVFDTCRDFIRTIPAQQHDPMRPEDLDTKGEDHIADETRYACMSRPLIARPRIADRDPLATPDGFGRGGARAWGW